jgi:hypothetical protein
MKKLEDIPKKDIFEAPEGYFDKLPGIIQARVAKPASDGPWVSSFRMTLRYALPVLVIGIAFWFYLRMPDATSAEDLLASVDTSNLVAYLEESEITADVLLENIELSNEDAEAIENRAFNELQVNDEDVEYLSNEFGIDNF